MKIFVYTLREFDELPFFEKFSKQYGVEFGYTTQSPGPENYHLAKGYDAISIITTPTPAEMIDAMKENGVKVISTRTIGYDHIDVKHAFEVGMGVTNVTYDPASVADYTIMLMLIACRKLRYIMDTENVQDYTLKGKRPGRCPRAPWASSEPADRSDGHRAPVSGFGCRILAYDIFPKDAVREHAEYVDVDTLYAESDLITLHAPALEDKLPHDR